MASVLIAAGEVRSMTSTLLAAVCSGYIKSITSIADCALGVFEGSVSKLSLRTLFLCFLSLPRRKPRKKALPAYRPQVVGRRTRRPSQTGLALPTSARLPGRSGDSQLQPWLNTGTKVYTTSLAANVSYPGPLKYSASKAPSFKIGRKARLPSCGTQRTPRRTRRACHIEARWNSPLTPGHTRGSSVWNSANPFCLLLSGLRCRRRFRILLPSSVKPPLPGERLASLMSRQASRRSSPA